jgi:lipopolysaccharide transport system ATP-binding protein
MSEDTAAIRLCGVSKKYPIYARNLDRVIEAFHPLRRKYHHDFWALRDVDLEVRRGETLGILGVNGSGKSTLLQIICSILQPSSGSVEVHGRIAALIELGAGFNPELTGRQNAEMNCMISGLSRRATRDVLPDIESFADIGEFFDQPVNTYSSGMFMRVAFSTAVHVDPEILVIDEALAVGDARFQQKCFRKFREFQDAGKTILLVTHDRFTVPRLCTGAVMLNSGRVVGRGEPRVITDLYSRFLTLGEQAFAAAPDRAGTGGADARPAVEPPTVAAAVDWDSDSSGADRCERNPTYNRNEVRFGQGGAAVVDYRIRCGNKINPADVRAGSELELIVRVRYDDAADAPLVGFTFRTAEGIVVAGSHSGWLGRQLDSRAAGEIADYRFVMRAHLAPGNWFVDISVARDEATMLDTREAVVHLTVWSPQRQVGMAHVECVMDEIR